MRDISSYSEANHISFCVLAGLILGRSLNYSFLSLPDRKKRRQWRRPQRWGRTVGKRGPQRCRVSRRQNRLHSGLQQQIWVGPVRKLSHRDEDFPKSVFNSIFFFQDGGSHSQAKHFPAESTERGSDPGDHAGDGLRDGVCQDLGARIRAQTICRNSEVAPPNEKGIFYTSWLWLISSIFWWRWSGILFLKLKVWYWARNFII